MHGHWPTLVTLVLAVGPGGPEEEQRAFAAVPWSSPLRGHIMNVVCPMQDDYLQRMDLSSLQLPTWLRNSRKKQKKQESTEPFPAKEKNRKPIFEEYDGMNFFPFRTHEDPVGRCPVKYHPIMDARRIWPPVLIGVVCACERSRCTLRGSHICITVYVAHTVLKHNIGFTKELLSVDCICAARSAHLIKFSLPKIVS